MTCQRGIGGRERPHIVAISVFFCVAGAMLLGSGQTAHAAVLFDNGSSYQPGGGLWNEPIQRLYEDFSLDSAASITRIDWRHYDVSSLVYDYTTVSIFSSSGPEMSTPLFTADLVATRTPNGTSGYGRPGYDYVLTGLDIDLPAGTYWLGLLSIATNNEGMGSWAETSGGPQTIPGLRLISPLFPAPGTTYSANLSFRLSGEVIPEPATLGLLALGSLSLWRRRRA